MKPTLFILCVLLNCTFLFAQKNYNEAITMGDNALREGNFKKAINLYFAAEAFDPLKKEEVKTKINKTFDKIQELKIQADKDRTEAIRQKEISDSLLLVAETALKTADSSFMLSDRALAKAERLEYYVKTTGFDKAVKEKFKDWKGFDKYSVLDERKREKILEKIDILDLSGKGLTQIPYELTFCPNLKHINLLRNPNINWEESEKTLANLGKNITIYVSVKDLSAIDSNYWSLITGIEILENKLNKIPENILQQKQLIYLNLSASVYEKNNLYKLPSELFKLKQLECLYLSCCQIDSLPPEIEQLQKLKYLDLSSNNISDIPAEIGQLQNLRDLDLSFNLGIHKIPAEMGQLLNLNVLDLSICGIFRLPPEIGQLQNLHYLSISNLMNSYSEAEKEEIKKWLPNCEISFF